MVSKAKSLSLLKYLLALALLALILSHAQTDKITLYLKEMSLWHLAIALLFVSLAQIASALRMRFFFTASGVTLGARFAIVLYYVGAFYNFLLPGGIGGDAYKVILVKRRMEMPAMQGIRIMLADRASGLCIILLMMFAALCGFDFSRSIPHARALLAAAAAFTLLSYLICSQLLLKQRWRVMLLSLPYSLAVQCMWIVTLLTLWESIGGAQHVLPYIVLYCAASISGMLPISVGGLGIKEMTYFYGADMIKHFSGAHVVPDPNLGVALSLCLFAMGFFAALPGLLWLEKVVKIPHI